MWGLTPCFYTLKVAYLKQSYKIVLRLVVPEVTAIFNTALRPKWKFCKGLCYSSMETIWNKIYCDCYFNTTRY